MNTNRTIQHQTKEQLWESACELLDQAHEHMGPFNKCMEELRPFVDQLVRLELLAHGGNAALVDKFREAQSQDDCDEVTSSTEEVLNSLVANLIHDMAEQKKQTDRQEAEEN